MNNEISLSEKLELSKTFDAKVSDIYVTNGYKGQAIQVRGKKVNINGNERVVDPYELMGMIKNVTQTIGEYKNMNNAYGDFVIVGLRKIRRDMVSMLKSNFNIHWGLDEGKTIFFM